MVKSIMQEKTAVLYELHEMPETLQKSISKTDSLCVFDAAAWLLRDNETLMRERAKLEALYLKRTKYLNEINLITIELAENLCSKTGAENKKIKLFERAPEDRKGLNSNYMLQRHLYLNISENLRPQGIVDFQESLEAFIFEFYAYCYPEYGVTESVELSEWGIRLNTFICQRPAFTTIICCSQLWPEFFEQTPKKLEDLKNNTNVLASQGNFLTAFLTDSTKYGFVACDSKSWQPDAEFQVLVDLLKREGPLLVGGFYSTKRYQSEPTLERRIGTCVIKGWKKGSEIEDNGAVGHMVILVGAAIDVGEFLVFYVDPSHPSPQQIFMMSYARFCRNIGTTRQEIFCNLPEGSSPRSFFFSHLSLNPKLEKTEIDENKISPNHHTSTLFSYRNITAAVAAIAYALKSST